MISKYVIQTVNDIKDPERVKLYWKPLQIEKRVQDRYYCIGEIYKVNDNFRLKYSNGEEDFELAKKEGFFGYEGCSDFGEEYDAQFIISERTVSKKRIDFEEYLDSWCVNPQLKDAVSPYYLLGLTESNLPHDYFLFFPVWSNKDTNFSFITCIRGTKYNVNTRDKVYQSNENEELTLEIEENNPYDNNACCLNYKGEKLGYLNRCLKKQVLRWKDEGKSLQFSVGRKNGTVRAPSLYVAIRVGE